MNDETLVFLDLWSFILLIQVRVLRKKLKNKQLFLRPFLIVCSKLKRLELENEKKWEVTLIDPHLNVIFILNNSF